MKRITEEIHENIPDFDKIDKYYPNDMDRCHKRPYYVEADKTCGITEHPTFSPNSYCAIIGSYK